MLYFDPILGMNQRDFRDEPQKLHLLNQELETKGLSAFPTTDLKLEPKVESLESVALRDFKTIL